MTTETKLDRDMILSRRCITVLRSMREHRFGRVFDKNRGYFSVLSKPMDFLTIKSKLETNLYGNIAVEFPEDVRLVFANAMLYHPPENPVHKMAEELKKIFEISWESVKKQTRPEAFSSTSFYLEPLTPEKALRAAKIKIRFAHTIVKAKYRKVIEESSNKADVMMKIQREKQRLEKRQREEKERIEAEIRVRVLKRRKTEQLALKKVEEEGISTGNINLVGEKELVNLCGGSSLARTRWVESFGLIIKKDNDGDDCLMEACDSDHEEGEIY